MPRIDPNGLVRTAIEEVSGGKGRNEAGFMMLLQLRDDGRTEAEAAEAGTSYVAAVSGLKSHPYTMDEFMASLRSVYNKPARGQWCDDGEPEPDTELDSPQDDDVLPDVEPEADAKLGANPEAADDAAVLAAPHSAARAVTGKLPVVPERDKQKASGFLKQTVGLEIVRIMKHGEADGFHVAHLADGRKVDLGRTAKFMSEGAVRIAVVDGLGTQLPPIKKGVWRKVLGAMLKLVEVEAGFTPEEMVTEWVESFLAAGRAIGCPSFKDAAPKVAYAFDAMNGRSMAVCT